MSYEIRRQHKPNLLNIKGGEIGWIYNDEGRGLTFTYKEDAKEFIKFLKKNGVKERGLKVVDNDPFPYNMS